MIFIKSLLCFVLIFILFCCNEPNVDANRMIVVSGGFTNCPRTRETRSTVVYYVDVEKWLVEEHGDFTIHNEIMPFQLHYGYLPEPDAGFMLLLRRTSILKAGGRGETYQLHRMQHIDNNIWNPLAEPDNLIANIQWETHEAPAYRGNRTRYGACGAVHSGVPYMFGGSGMEVLISRFNGNELWEFMDVALRVERVNCGAAAYEASVHIYICGTDYNSFHYNDARTCERFDVGPGHGDTLVIASMNRPRCGNFLIAAGHRLYAVGGNWDGSAETLDLTEPGPGGRGIWHMLRESMAIGRKYAMAVYDDRNNLIFVVGGMDINATAFSTTESLDLSEDPPSWSWRHIPNMPCGRFSSGIMLFYEDSNK